MREGPVTEVALLSIKNPQPPTNPDKDDDLSSRISAEVQHLLHHAASEQATYSGHAVTLLQCQADPSLIFLIGGWNSVSHHMNDWIPGPINQGLMKSLGEYVDVRYMFHIDAEPGERSKVSSTGRYTARDGGRAPCDSRLRNVNSRNRTDGLSEMFSHGWRLDRGFFGNEKDSGKGIHLIETTVVVFTIGEREDRARTRDLVTEILEAGTAEQEFHAVKMVDCVQPSERV